MKKRKSLSTDKQNGTERLGKQTDTVTEQKRVRERQEETCVEEEAEGESE